MRSGMGSDIGNSICQQMGFASASMIDGESGWNHQLDDAVGIRALMIDQMNRSFHSVPAPLNVYTECVNHGNDMMVECMSSLDGEDCLESGNECATDLDCCDRMFCSPVSGICVDSVTYLIHSKTSIFHSSK